MSKYVITGAGALNGEIEISGSKNSALPLLCASLLCYGESEFVNVPHLSDINVMLDIISSLGCRVDFENGVCRVNPGELSENFVSFEKAGRIRASFLVAGPLLARFKKAVVSLPGGCAIGSRPVDLHIKGLKALGAECEVSNGYAHFSCEKLTGNHIYLDFPSVGATQNLIMASVLATGETVIENCASEPEISDLVMFLNKCGARISGEGTDRIIVSGVQKLHGCRHSVIPDRIEAGTYMIATASAGGNVRIKNVNCSHLSAVISKLREVGADICEFSGELSIRADSLTNPADIKTLPFPGFPTDMQAQFASLLCRVKGTSVITETIFENRFMYIPELIRMNADIKLDGRSAVINGRNTLKGSEVKSTDLRAGAALVVAGLGALGKTIVDDKDDFIKRGYSSFASKLQKLGADIEEIL